MKLTDIFKKKETRMLQSELARMVTGYSPSFSTYSGGVYEMDLTVAAIDSFARHISKANPKIKGNSYSSMQRQWQTYMNDTMTTSQFLYRCATIYECEHNLIILPIYDQYNAICGFYPISSIGSKVQSVNGVMMLEYQLNNKRQAIPYSEVAHLRSHQYKSEFFGEGNQSLGPTLELLDTQNQGIINGVKQSAVIRFIGQISTILKPEDMKKERQRLMEDNLSSDNNSGILLYDAKYKELKQIDSKPFVIDADQRKQIEDNVFNYFGTNKSILQNDYTETQWGSFYEGKCEPFLNQLSQALTRLLFTDKELAFENEILFESIRLQHADTKTKLELVTQLRDRGMLNGNEGRAILNLSPMGEEGDKYYIRREYIDSDKLDEKPMEDKKDEEQTDDQ